MCVRSKMTVHYSSNNGSIIEIQVISKREIVARQFSVDHKDCKLKKIGEFSWTCKQKVEILKCSEITERLTNHRLPAVLVAVGTYSKDGCEVTCYILGVQLKFSKFVALKKITIQSKSLGVGINKQDLQAKLIDGPSVLILHGNTLTLCFNETHCILNEYRHTLTLAGTPAAICCNDANQQGTPEAEIICVKHVQDRHLVVSLLYTVENCQLHNVLERKSKVLVVSQFYDKQFSDLDAGLFIPLEYSETITCVHIQYLAIQQSHFCSKIFVGTSDNFVLHIENGRLMRCIALEESVIFERCAITDIHSSPSVPENRLLISQNSNLTVLNTNFKVEKKYSGIMHVFQGDFVGNGTSQYLLLDNVSEIKTWILTDLDTLCISSEGVQNCNGETEVGSNTKTAVQALQARLQRENMNLHDEQQLCDQRSEFLKDMLSRQVALAQGHRQLPQIEKKVNLMSVISGPASLVSKERQPDICTPEAVVQTDLLWQKTYRDKWCIAADIVNTSARDVYAWLEVVPASESGFTSSSTCRSKSVTCQSQTGTLPYSAIQTDTTRCPFFSETKRIKTVEDIVLNSSTAGSHFPENGGKMRNRETLLCVTSLPIFGKLGCHTLFVLVHWRYVSSVTGIGDGSCLTSVKQTTNLQQDVDCERTHTIHCEKITLSSTDVVERKYELRLNVQPESDNITMTDLKEWRCNNLAWREMQIVHHLTLRSLPGILCHMEPLLTERCGFVYNSQYDCYVTEIPALGSVQLQLPTTPSTEHRGLDVYTSCEKDLLLLIHHLYSRLPDHVIILPQEVTSSNYLQTVLPSMQRETQYLSQSIRKLLNDHDSQKESVVPEEQETDVGDFRKIGEKFKREKERLLVKQKVTIAGEIVENFSLQVDRLKKQTDLTLALSGDV